MDNRNNIRPDLRIFGVSELDAGFIYIVEDRGRFKIGKSKNASSRLRATKTWLPDMRLVGCKPFWNVSETERNLQTAFSRSWYSGEWFEFECEDDKTILIDGFSAFSDTDRDWNSVDFIYWFNGDGLAEFVIERGRQRLSLPRFLKQESDVKRVP